MGTEEFWIPAAIAALGTGVQAVNTSQARSRENAGEVQNILDQQKLQSKANSQVKQLTQKIGQNTPDQLAKQATGAYVDVLRKNAAGTQKGGPSSVDNLFGAPTSSLSPTSAGSSRYKAGTAASQNEVGDYGNTLATEMGNIDAATRQRQNEALDMGGLSTNLNLLGAESYTKNFSDRLAASAAGQTSPWASLLGSVLQNSGNAMSKNAGPKPGAAPIGSGIDWSQVAPITTDIYNPAPT